MKLTITHSESDIEVVRTLMAECQQAVQNRREQWAMTRDRFTPETVWRAMVGCLVTTQQRSQPGSLADRFLRTHPFTLDLALCLQHADRLVEFVKDELTRAGLRRANKIYESFRANLTTFQTERIVSSLASLCALFDAPGKALERETARAFQGASGHHGLHGLGPKQSRNFLLNLGLMRYEIPLDSGIAAWINENLSEEGWQLVLSPKVLLDETYYSVIVDALQALCEDAGMLPVDFDAAVFSLPRSRRRITRRQNRRRDSFPRAARAGGG